MTDHVTFEAKKNGLTQTQDGLWKVSLTVAPDQMPVELTTAPMGQRLAVVIVALKDDGEVDPGNVFPEEITRAEGGRAVTSAAMLCDNPDFQRWIHDVAQKQMKWSAALGAVIEEGMPCDMAAFELRQLCGISSRRELATNDDARQKFYDLREQFIRRDQIR